MSGGRALGDVEEEAVGGTGTARNLPASSPIAQKIPCLIPKGEDAIDINNEGVNKEDIGMEVQMDEEEAAMKAADEMIEGFWRD